MSDPRFVQLEIIDNATIVRHFEVVEEKPKRRGFPPGESADNYMKLVAAALKRQARQSGDDALPDEERDRIVELAEKVGGDVVGEVAGGYEKLVSVRPRATSCSTDAEIIAALGVARENLKKYLASGLESRMVGGMGGYVTAQPSY